MDRNEAVERLLEAYSAYYDVERVDEGDLVARCDFHFRGERYLLTRGVNLWSEEDHEYVYLHSGGTLDEDTVRRAAEHTLADGTPRIVPGEDHRCSALTTLLVYDSITDSASKLISTYSYHRSFKLMLNGWMEHRIVAVVASEERVLCSRRGRDTRRSVARSLGLGKR